jgi:hypothetical protein
MRNAVNTLASVKLVSSIEVLMADVVGRICFTADRQNIIFSPETSSSAGARSYPWHVLRSGSLLRKFMESFTLTRIHSGRAMFTYTLCTSPDALDEWFAEHGKEIDAA